MSNSIFQQLDFNDFAKDSKEIDIDIFDIEKHGIIEVYENEGYPALFLKEVESFDLQTLKLIAEIQHACWNFQKVLFLYVYTKTEIRIYNCSVKPFVLDKNIADLKLKSQLQELQLFCCEETDEVKLKTLNTLFSRIAIDTGFIWSAIEAKEIKDKLNLQNRVDKYLIKSLINVSRKLEKEGLKDKDIIHKLVMRSLFLLYLEDKGATTKPFYATFLDHADSYFKVLENIEATYNLFQRLSNDFNGSLFTITQEERNLVKLNHLELIKKCFINGCENDEQITFFEGWRLFDFSIIRIELLSEIYENFLSELDEKNKKDSGTFYTPPSLVELILNEKLPIQNDKTNYNIKTLDPSCGSGIFLVQSFKRLVKRYENKCQKKLTDFDILVKILKDNIFGIEIEGKSIKVAAFSLYLALLDNLDPKTGWWNGNIKFPYLINDPEDSTLNEQGYNLFKRDTISDFEISELQNFQLVVGNPPFGTKKLLPSIINYCKKQNFAQEMVLPFMHKATLLAPKGEIALIFNTKVLTNTRGTYQNFRKWLLTYNYVEKIYNFSILRDIPKEFGGQLFGSAKTPICIVFYQKENPENPKDTITYYAPKTYIKNDVLEGIVIDSSDVKHLPRNDCEKKDSKIWKIAMWGNYFDFELIEKIESKYNSLEEYFETNKNEWIKGSGLHSPSKEQIEENKFFTPIEYIETGLIDKYYTSKNALVPNSKIYRPTNELLYKSPFLIIKEGQKDKEYCSSIIDFDCYHMAYSIVNSDIQILKVLSSFINSVFSNYYLSLSSASWGIERERVQSNEMLQLPSVIENIEAKNIIKLSSKVDEIISIKKSNKVSQDISHLEKEIDQIIFNDILKLTEDEQIIIKDTLDYSLDLFENKEKSKAVLPVNKIGIYINRLTKELNDWLDDVDLKASATIYDINRNCPLYLVKISFGNEEKPVFESKEDIYKELKILDEKLWEEEAQNLYFRKKLNYYDGDHVYIIKPNQRRFWSQTAAMEDCKSLLVEIANGNG
ncbi:endonuclease [Flavobacterium cheongpyeongense]|uniref:site-specific DNA-methyltransferase (adenine-specific) n=1 Tax=Flavobacterium cheongpyeongense TaxID=2212651 RepID=A0A2V4BV14_9FLAO|nr:N-6 DNA methylase [Flavobacterium cheongpyeongense]PXY41703.1 endonuclease [Flavobacterium cheongpyeongense]